MEDVTEIEESLEMIVDNTSKANEKESKRLARVSDISDREARFIFEYCANFNKVDAYRKAFNTHQHADEVALKADDLLNRPEIERRVKNELAKKLDAKLIAAPHFLMNYIQDILSLDIRDFYEDDGLHVKPLDQIPFEKRKYLRIGKVTTNAKTGAAYVTYELPQFSATLTTLLDIVKIVTQVQAKTPGDTNDAEEARQRRERILNAVE